MKRLSNKYGKNSKNNKFHKILPVEREKVKKGFTKSAKFAKIAEVTRISYRSSGEKLISYKRDTIHNY